MEWFPFILIGIGIVSIILSFVVKSPAAKISKEVEQLSFDYYKDIQQMKRRLKVIEEELMLEPDVQMAVKTSKKKPVHDIIRSQIHALNQQGYTIHEISKRSSLSEQDVRDVLGGRR